MMYESNKTLKEKLLPVTICAMTTFLASPVFASGFQLIEQSAVTVGLAGAGTAVNDNPSIQFYNPAGMAFVEHPEIALSAVGIFPNIQYHPTTATDLSFINSSILATSDQNSPAKNAVVPGLYLIYPIDSRLTLGLSTEIPFGLSTDYDDNSAARYFATESTLEMINLNPSFSIKATDQLAFGFGVDVLFANVTLNQAVDAASITGGVLTNDVIVENKARDTGVGWNAGTFWKATPSTDVGLAYHSKIRLDLSGDSTIIGLPSDYFSQAVAASDGLHDAYVNGTITLPDYATFSIKQQIQPWWDVLMDLSYTDWSVIKNITLNFSGDRTGNNYPINLPASTQVVNYKNTWRISLGQEFQINPIWKLRMGVAFDESPVRTLYRDAREPDNDRYWLSLGSNIKLSHKLDLDFGYTHIIFKDASVYQSLQPLPGMNQIYAASYSANANLIGAQLNYHFNA